MLTTRDLTEEEARSTAREEARDAVDYPLDNLMAPSQVHGLTHENDVSSWDNVDRDALETELSRSANVMLTEGQRPFSGIKHGLAVVLCRQDLSRCPLEDLVHETAEEAVKNGYWPYKMSRTDVTQLLHEGTRPEWFHECEQEAYNVVTAGIMEGLDPRK